MIRRLILPLALLAGCRTTTTSTPANMGSAIVMRAEPVFAWEMRETDRLVGYVVRFQSGDTAPETYYSVRNEHNQELGIVDSSGRAYRYRAHQRDPEWLGTGTVERCAKLVLDTSESARMIATDLARLSEKRSKSAPR